MCKYNANATGPGVRGSREEASCGDIRRAVCRALMLLIALCAAESACGGAKSAWYELFLPDSVESWKAAGPVRTYGRSNLFDYMNGAGELYLAYDFRELAVRKYASPGEPEFVAEIFLMSSSRDAYGVFSHEHAEGSSGVASIGQDRDYAAGLLRFWKGTFFVRILADRETAGAKSAVLALGRLISKAIPAEGARPDLLAPLPRTGLVRESIRYFHKHTVLNYHYFLADSNILNLSEKTDAVLAQYRIEDHKPRLLVVRYPNAADASAAYAQFGRTYFKDRPVSNAAFRIEKIERDEYVGMRRDGRILRFVFDAGSKEQCSRLLGK